MAVFSEAPFSISCTKGLWYVKRKFLGETNIIKVKFALIIKILLISFCFSPQLMLLLVSLLMYDSSPFTAKFPILVIPFPLEPCNSCGLLEFPLMYS